MLDLIPIRRLIVTCDSIHHCGVICKLDYGVTDMDRNTVKSEQ